MVGQSRKFWITLSLGLLGAATLVTLLALYWDGTSRMEEWALLRALGASRRKTQALLLLEQFLLLLLGSTLGWCLGWGGSLLAAEGIGQQAAVQMSRVPLWQGFLARRSFWEPAPWEGWSPCGCCGKGYCPVSLRGYGIMRTIRTEEIERKQENHDFTTIALYCGHCRSRNLQRSGQNPVHHPAQSHQDGTGTGTGMGIQIFERTNKGVHLSRDGEIFLGYARQVLEQADLLESRYKKQAGASRNSPCPPSTIPLR